MLNSFLCSGVSAYCSLFFVKIFSLCNRYRFCQLDSSATAWRDQGLFQHLLQAVVVKSVCEQMLTYACSDVVYVAETAMCTETKVFSVEYMHGQEKMAAKQQYASCNMHIAAVLCYLTNE